MFIPYGIFSKDSCQHATKAEDWKETASLPSDGFSVAFYRSHIKMKPRYNAQQHQQQHQTKKQMQQVSTISDITTEHICTRYTSWSFFPRHDRREHLYKVYTSSPLVLRHDRRANIYKVNFFTVRSQTPAASRGYSRERGALCRVYSLLYLDLSDWHIRLQQSCADILFCLWRPTCCKFPETFQHLKVKPRTILARSL